MIEPDERGIYFLESSVNLLLLELHPLQFLFLHPFPLLPLSGFGHLFEPCAHVHLLSERSLLSPLRYVLFAFIILLKKTALTVSDFRGT